MKFNCPSPEQIKKEMEAWHLWFAWRPVRVGEADCRWLETVQRRGVFHVSWHEAWWTWEYRA